MALSFFSSASTWLKAIRELSSMATWTNSHQMTNRSPKTTANWVFASDHSRGGRFHS
ncbi:hypothetical protein QE379_000099 [Sphingomonas sp. SORGH_AS 879]|nr:hypothetical protein [Sphingomonas sp. SORGH_AS_0879]